MKYVFLLVINIMLTGLVKGQDTYVLFKGGKTYQKKSVLMFYDLIEGWELKETDDQIIFTFNGLIEYLPFQQLVYLKDYHESRLGK
ncbi:hypothetical protein IFO69_00045 [Echinicola sp. CAU 1574]|uniref:Uncharacterized protein n=1 Tax=Echinicola arenosa TaxID=2774144 RepID=A0ABR9AER4_9BACT|nr:hypothetical protein [Echinicola arenosa]MBD8487123.1 hypothetical protein [Echinicola arenosa]